MTLANLAFMLIAAAGGAGTLEERIDLYDPMSGAFLGAERTSFAPDGRRLRWVITDAQGDRTLVFFVMHDDQGREAEAVYYEGDAPLPTREAFTYSEDGRLQTTTYFSEPGVAAERTESVRDDNGREILKNYYRRDGSQYGVEKVLWDTAGRKMGWDFRYLEKEGGASFRYTYESFDGSGEWSRRTRSRDGISEQVEVRTRVTGMTRSELPTPVPFAFGTVSTELAETSPSFSRDGRTMVFARYGEDWEVKEPFIAHFEDGRWRVEALTTLGPVYNLAIAPDARTIIYALRAADSVTLYRTRLGDNGWSAAENLTDRFGLAGAYPCLTADGTLFFYDGDGESGSGIYSALRAGQGFGPVEPVFISDEATTFDPFTWDGRTLLVTRCFDDFCESGAKNGVWQVPVKGAGGGRPAKLPNLPYVWGVQPVEPLGLFVFTDGEDILAVPLESAGYD